MAVAALATGCMGKIPNPSVAPNATLTLKDDLTNTPLPAELAEAVNAYLADAYTIDGADAWQATAKRTLIRVQTPFENYVIALLLNSSDWIVGIDMHPLGSIVYRAYVNDDEQKGERLLELTRREAAAPAARAAIPAEAAEAPGRLRLKALHNPIRHLADVRGLGVERGARGADPADFGK